ncbi:MAG: hypothetical protein PHX80_04115 [Candidatus Nanoarchaeia archaeon]|nr:hypothetical protein [Candidatus Nanoarchaeia archaeon]
MKDRILTVVIEDEEIVIRLGIETLKEATILSPALEGYGEILIPDPEEWAKVIVKYLNDETEEDGTTPVSKMFDSIFVDVIEQGEKGFEIKGETIG